MEKINNNNLITGYIKQMLHDFNLPKAKVVDNNTVLYENGYYIKDNKLCIAKSIDGNIQLEELDFYRYNCAYANITKNLELNSSLYDSYTHRYLGDYLRFYRDYKKVDLMSMYNCNCNNVSGEVNLIVKDNIEDNNSKSLFEFNSDDDRFVFYKIPVKFDKEYSIAIDSSFPIEFVTCFYSNNRVSFINNQDKPEEWSKILNEFYKYTAQRVGGLVFNKPFVYSKLVNLLDSINIDKTTRRDLYSQESNLTLIIKVPSQNKSSLVVLEGDYSKASEYTFNVSGNVLGETSSTLDNLKSWYVLRDGEYSLILDSNTEYYKDEKMEIKNDSAFVIGNTYYVKDGDVATAIVLENVPYYDFSDSTQTVNYNVCNYYFTPLYYASVDDFPEVPTKTSSNYLYIDSSTGNAYSYDLESNSYLQISDSISSNKNIYQREYNSKMQLLYVNDGINYAFADKLIAYILGLCITEDDNIPDNIRRLQKYFNEKIGYRPNRYGQYDTKLRDITYDTISNSGLLVKTFDSIGYVDKDIERELGATVNHDTKLHSIQGGVR